MVRCDLILFWFKCFLTSTILAVASLEKSKIKLKLTVTAKDNVC